MLQTAIEVVSVKPLVFDPARPVPHKHAVTLSSGKKCFVTADGVVAGVSEAEFLAATPVTPTAAAAHA